MNTHHPQLAEQILRHCADAGLRVSTAESCTGGLLAHRLTCIAGASVVFMGGVVAYHNDVKQGVLGVSGATLDRHGAVSEETAREMAENARKVFGTEFGVSTTGIAGPAGGTPTKPVGLVFIAVAHPEGMIVTRNQFQGDRQQVQAESVEKALELLAKAVGL